MSDPTPSPDADDRRRKSAIFRDPRVDRLVSWGLGLVPVVAVAFAGSWAKAFESHFASLDDGQSKISHDLDDFKIDLADKLAGIKQDVALLKQNGSELSEVKATLLRYEERILRLEREGKK